MRFTNNLSQRNLFSLLVINSPRITMLIIYSKNLLFNKRNNLSRRNLNILLLLIIPHRKILLVIITNLSLSLSVIQVSFSQQTISKLISKINSQNSNKLDSLIYNQKILRSNNKTKFNYKEAFSQTSQKSNKISYHSHRLYLQSLKSTLKKNLFNSKTLIKIKFNLSSLRITLLSPRVSSLPIIINLQDSNQPQIHLLLNLSIKTRHNNKINKQSNNLNKPLPKESIPFFHKKTSRKKKTQSNPNLT
jgi:hypothetical protein